MKALKTIVATAVIVFALTTVATAGVRHLGDRDGDARHPAYAQTAAQSAGAATLSAEQFAALLKAAGDDGSKHSAKHATRTHEKAQKRSRTHASEADHDGAGARHSDGQQQGSGVAAHHAEAAAHDGGSQGGGTHDSGCD